MSSTECTDMNTFGLFSFRWEALSLLVGRLSLAICSIGWVDSTLSQTHGSQTFPMFHVWSTIRSLGSFGLTRQKAPMKPWPRRVFGGSFVSGVFLQVPSENAQRDPFPHPSRFKPASRNLVQCFLLLFLLLRDQIKCSDWHHLFQRVMNQPCQLW